MHAHIVLAILTFASILSILPRQALSESAAVVAPATAEGQKVITSVESGERLLALLRAGDYTALESATKEIQAKFESGALSDIQLRNTYRQFHKIGHQDLTRIDEWLKTAPKSYAAHLIRGLYFKRMDSEGRTGHYINRTSSGSNALLRQYQDLATQELLTSLKLAKKPFLSVFYLLDLTKLGGSREHSLALISAANVMLPNNTLARNRYMSSLKPRWGGSYEEMQEFISRSKEEGLNTAGLNQLEAIMYDDMAFTALQHGDKENASKYLDRAGDLAQRVGGDFRKEWLPFSHTPCSEKFESQKTC
jgi:Domain of unknown function (DUF4034)